jgi:predicted RNase H-like HicB family nuclease
MAKQEIVTSEEYTYTVIFELDESGGYVATCPALPGLIATDRSLERTRAQAFSAIRAILETWRRDGWPLPPSEAQAPLQERISVVLQRAVSGCIHAVVHRVVHPLPTGCSPERGINFH